MDFKTSALVSPRQPVRSEASILTGCRLSRTSWRWSVCDKYGDDCQKSHLLTKYRIELILANIVDRMLCINATCLRESHGKRNYYLGLSHKCRTSPLEDSHMTCGTYHFGWPDRMFNSTSLIRHIPKKIVLAGKNCIKHFSCLNFFY